MIFGGSPILGDLHFSLPKKIYISYLVFSEMIGFTAVSLACRVATRYLSSVGPGYYKGNKQGRRFTSFHEIQVKRARVICI